MSTWLKVTCAPTSTHPLPPSLLVPTQVKFNSPPLCELSHSHNSPQPSPKATSSKPSLTPLSELVRSLIPTAPLSSTSPPSPCSTLRTRPSSMVDVNVQDPNYGDSLFGHNISLTPPLAPPWLHSKPSAPTISQALRRSYISYMLPLASSSDPPG